MQLSVKQLDATLSSMGEGLLVINREYKVMVMNQAGGILLRIAPSDAVGKNVEDIFPLLKDDIPLPRTEAPIVHAIQGLNIIHIGLKDNFSCKNKVGNVFPIAMVVAPLLEEEVTGAVILFRDVSEEKEIDKAKTEFVSLASHQLRTPLSTINWYTEMLLAGDAGAVTPEQRKYLEEIYMGNQRMVELVNALLNVSRLELGTFVIEPEPTNITELARSVIDEQRPQIDNKTLTIFSSFEEKIPLISADPKLLRAVFQNLLSNAVKYTPEGGKIEFTLSLDNKKKMVLLTVSDTGYGIPKNQQDKIFTKLFRASNVREKDTEGMGLGLYIIKSIVQHSGGKIWFSSPRSKSRIIDESLPIRQSGPLDEESSKNLGTTFYVTLPLKG